MPMHPRALSVLSSSLALGACSLMVDTNDLASGDRTPAVSTLDAVLPVDAGRADGPAGDTGAVTASPCARADAPSLCEDFEPGISPVWKQQDVVSAFLMTSTLRSVSPPNALHAEKRVGTAPGKARLIGDVPPLGARTTCDLDVLVADLQPDSAQLMVFALAFRWGDDYLELDLRSTRARGGNVLEHGTVGGRAVDRSTDLAEPFPVGRWVHLRLDVRTTPAATFTVWVDGKEAIAPRSLAARAGAAAQIYVGGVLEFGNGMTWDVYTDNVACDVVP